MKVTRNWLRQYVELDLEPGELADQLTRIGLEVEGIEEIRADFEGVIVAEVRTRDPHPNADRLSLCRVFDGKEERQIVCGATNFQAGDKVALAVAGCTLPTPEGEKPFTIKVGKIRGVESQGMMCSPAELGLARASDGLLILPGEARVGQSFAEHLGRPGGDVIFDLETTPNRPDWNSVIGIARELAALNRLPLNLPAAEPPATGDAVEGQVAVRIEAPDLCARYTARVIRGVKIGPSPEWLRSILERLGLRSINNVVDVTNYVMLETGQPLHAFDYHLLAAEAGKPTIIVRRAVAGEAFTTLDESEHELTDQTLVIGDPAKAVALAGVMGGANSEIQDSTADVLLESAWFQPSNIRATARRFGLRTDASYRFERGADVAICDYASRRAAALILETAGGVLAGSVVDAWPEKPVPREIPLRHARTDALLGVTIPSKEQDDYLRGLGLECLEAGEEVSSFRIPTFRVDLKRETDLIEEVVRMYGIDSIPATAPRGAVGQHAHDSVHDALSEARLLMTGLGFHEAQGQTLIHGDIAARAVAGQPDGTVVPLAYPMSADMDTLRPSLLPGLLDSLGHNAVHRIEDAALFEIGRVFVRDDQQAVQEKRCLALAVTGLGSPWFWEGQDRERPVDVMDLKGALETLLERLGVGGVQFHRRADPSGLFVESAELRHGRDVIGEIGQVDPVWARKRLELRRPVFLAELNFDILVQRRKTARSFSPLPVFPSVRRDVALLVPEACTHQEMLTAIRKAKPANLAEVELFDVFRGKGIPEGRKSMAYALVYRHAERTLTDNEVNSAQETLVERLKAALEAEVR